MQPGIYVDIEKLSAVDRDLVVEFTNYMRDLHVIRLIGKQTSWLSRSAKRKLWKRAKAQSEPLVAGIVGVIKELTGSTNIELQWLANQCMSNNTNAMEDLRRLGRKLKQDL